MVSEQRGVSVRLLLSACLFIFLTACSLDAEKDASPTTAVSPPVPAAPRDIEALRALLPPEGLRFTPLFNQPLSSRDDRLRRLESVVQDMRDDLDTVVPALTQIAIKDGKVAEVQQQSLSAIVPPPVAPVPAIASAPIVLAQPAAEPAPMPAAPPALDSASPSAPRLPDLLVKPAQAPAAPIAAEKKPEVPVKVIGDVKAIRMADHQDKTRLVLDMTVEYSGAVTLQNNGRTLVVPLAQFNWQGAASKDIDSAELISGYRVADGNLYVDLMYPSRISERQVLLPGGGSRDYRTIIDLYSPDVHKN